MSDDEGKQVDIILILCFFSDMKKDKGRKKKDDAEGSDESDESDGGNDVDMAL